LTISKTDRRNRESLPMPRVALGFITIKRDQREIGRIHPSLVMPDRLAMGLFDVPARSPELLLERMHDPTIETRVLYAERHRPLKVFVGGLGDGYRITPQGLFEDNPILSGDRISMEVFEAIVQLATRNFTEWSNAADRILDEMPEG
jgi:hypothetical protein